MHLTTEAVVQNLAALRFGQVGGGQQPDKVRLSCKTAVENLQLL